MDRDVEEISLEQAFDVINDNYVSKLLQFLRGDSKIVSSHSEFTKVYQLIIHHCDNQDNNSEVFDCFRRFVKTYFDEEVMPQLHDKTNEALLTTIVKVWEDYTIYAKMMDRCFDYLNRYYLSNSSLQPIGANCLVMFKDRVFTKMKSQITDAVLVEISRDRNGEMINREAVKKTIQIYVDMGLLKPKPVKTRESAFLWQGDRNLATYDSMFETPYLKHTMNEFKQKANKWIQERNCPEYLTEVSLALEKEEENANYWLQPETKQKMLKLVVTELISNMANEVSSKDTGCIYMFQHRRLDELKLLFDVFKRDNTTFRLIIMKMNPYIMERGNKIVKDEALVKSPIEFT